MKLLVLCLALASAFAASAQAISAVDDLHWTSSGFINNSNSESVTHQSTFNTTAANVVWLQDDLQYSFNVTATSGTWSDVTQDGTITFNLIWNNIPGTLIFSRTDGAMTVAMEFIKGGQNIMPFSFILSTVTAL